MKKSRPIKQLSFSGGGSFGAVEIGILKRLLEIDPLQKYDIYTGISAGGLNSGYLSYFDDIKTGVNGMEKVYSDLKTKNVYELLPATRNSMFNTKPLFDTINQLIGDMSKEPLIQTLVGATNLDNGRLEIHNFNKLTKNERILLLMATSAIPVFFPPVLFNGHHYVDGGVLSNELLNVDHYTDYLNITYITPFSELPLYTGELDSVKSVFMRTYDILMRNYNDPLSKIDQNCLTDRGEINMYYVDNKCLKNYSILNFDHGQELIDIGFHNILSKRYRLC